MKDVINPAVIGLERYVSDSNKRLLIAARATNEYDGESEAQHKLRKRNERCQAWKEKALRGQFF